LHYLFLLNSFQKMWDCATWDVLSTYPLLWMAPQVRNVMNLFATWFLIYVKSYVAISSDSSWKRDLLLHYFDLGYSHVMCGHSVAQHLFHLWGSYCNLTFYIFWIQIIDFFPFFWATQVKSYFPVLGMDTWRTNKNMLQIERRLGEVL
jgi:hypothetical protein